MAKIDFSNGAIGMFLNMLLAFGLSRWLLCLFIPYVHCYSTRNMFNEPTHDVSERPISPKCKNLNCLALEDRTDSLSGDVGN
jgi:hypothetical protein